MSEATSPRRVPAIPEPERRIRVVIDTDAANEVDDQYAMALALAAPERIDLRGLVAAHFGDRAGAAGIERSYEEVQRVLELAGLAGRVPALRGSHPLRYGDEASPSAGVDFIVAEARLATAEDPLWVVALGPATDAVSAYLTDPSIAERMVVLFHGRTRWPEKCWNFNVYNDVRAVRTLFHAPLPLVLFDTGTYLRQPLEEAERLVAPHGRLGRYLVDIRRASPGYASAEKGLFDLGDIAMLVDPSLSEWEEVPCPTVNWDLLYDHRRTHGRMLRVYHIDRPGTFRLLSERLAAWDGRG
ncbi:MAG TPA: nucleoside hydrolase [Chloroflexota bacterium]|nr:nucleoside hydrolase [Chloroflexota bacterium]